MIIKPHTFVAAVRSAHSILTAHRAGARSIAELTKRTGHRPQEVADWCRVLALPIQGSAQPQRLLREHPSSLYHRGQPTPAQMLAPIDRTGDL